MPLHSLFRLAVAAALFAGVAAAQAATLTINPGVLTRNGEAKITYSNPARAGSVVRIDIDNGSRLDPESVSLEMTLDAEGKGTLTWPVPSGWKGAKFNAPNVPEVFRLIIDGE